MNLLRSDCVYSLHVLPVAKYLNVTAILSPGSKAGLQLVVFLAMRGPTRCTNSIKSSGDMRINFLYSLRSSLLRFCSKFS